MRCGVIGDHVAIRDIRFDMRGPLWPLGDLGRIYEERRLFDARLAQGSAQQLGALLNGEKSSAGTRHIVKGQRDPFTGAVNWAFGWRTGKRDAGRQQEA